VISAFKVKALLYIDKANLLKIEEVFDATKQKDLDLWRSSPLRPIAASGMGDVRAGRAARVAGW
jgi:hypothetical protein